MARLHVGLHALQGDIKKYKEQLDLVEIRPVDMSLPGAPGLRKWRKSVPPAFVFSVVLPRVVAELAPGKELDDALATSIEVATTLEARCIVLSTSTEIRPTAANRKRIAALFARIPGEGTLRFWEPRGMWEREDVIDTARAAGVLPVFDAARDDLPRGSVVYTRLRSLGAQTMLSAAALDRVARRLGERRDIFLVVEGTRGAAIRAKSTLVAALARSSRAPEAGSIVAPVAPIVRPLIAEDEEQ
ncbi:DUF72 domain-containing protein [Polyangium mundeleinium]|uniref:DUF72 domain-containing protein n=1 Tax=Polyangium mundeleinium TaxID=2995306 RepID=A0ABT5EYM3_9BACT|nr:DUF72 domain-containing protein [Polyangium mundeleinium]MDC0745916.1 DUF72 domain-containing protein [Polyangium mundeleinium]